MADKPTAPTPDGNKARPTGVASSIILDMADTTWRMFIPTIGLLMLGRVLDARYGLKPWLMLVGVTLGATIAALLVKHQLTRGEDK